MSETYTVGGDTWAEFSHHIREGQTFTPLESHNLLFIDLTIDQLLFPATIELELYLCDIWHHPKGGVLSHASHHLSFDWPWAGHKIIRFTMTPYACIAGTEYAIVVYQQLPALADNVKWYYDNGDATYPRGFRISKASEFEDWTTQGSDDHIFAEFGEPPLPKQEPLPPIQHFAVMDITQTPTFDGPQIRISSVGPIFYKRYLGPYTFIKNPSFEDWPDPLLPPTYWEWVPPDPTNRQAIRDTTDKTHGKQSLRMEFNGTLGWYVLNQDIDAIPLRGKRIWIKPDMKGTPIYFTGLWVSIDGTPPFHQQATPSSPDYWDYALIGATVKSDSTIIRIQLRVDSFITNPNTCQFDNLRNIAYYP